MARAKRLVDERVAELARQRELLNAIASLLCIVEPRDDYVGRDAAPRLQRPTVDMSA